MDDGTAKPRSGLRQWMRLSSSSKQKDDAATRARQNDGNDGAEGVDVTIRSRSKPSASSTPTFFSQASSVLTAQLHEPVQAGIKVLHDCADATVDVCFIHGLTGGRESTWTAPNCARSWPEALLPGKLSRARILTYGYDAYVVRRTAAGSNALDDHAKNLLVDLAADRAAVQATTRPIMFVVHSLGGLVCKAALLHARNNPERHLRHIFGAVKGIAFLGTPNLGSWMAKWAKIPVKALGLVTATSATLLEGLQTDDKHLRWIQREFCSMLREQREAGRPLEIICFFEELPMSRRVGKVVSEDSAILEGYSIASINAHHRDMVRFASEDDTGFKRIVGELRRWQADVNEVKEAPEPSYVRDARDDKCLESLKVTDPRRDKTRIERTKGGLLQDSYHWILDNEQFKAWKDHAESQLLWIKGDPGKGKTMLMCGIIDELAKPESAQCLAYFFFQAADSRINTATTCLRGILYALCVEHPQLISYIRAEYDRGGDHTFSDGNSWVTLADVFNSMTSDASLDSLCVVVDALDECTEGFSQLVELMCHSISTQTGIKWIISSRNLPEIEDRLREVLTGANQRLSLELNAESVADAVNAFIRHRVDKLAKLRNYDCKTRRAVSSYLEQNAEGTFLWVALVCKNLESRRRWDTVPSMTSFPPGLGELYQRMMEQIYLEDGEGVCKRALAVCTTAYRPLTLHELGALMAVADRPEMSWADEPTMEEVVGLCGSFLTLRNDSVHFVHHSAKEFLTGELASRLLFPDGQRKCHHQLFLSCLQVMHQSLRRDLYGLADPAISIDDVQAPSPDPLRAAAYACTAWFRHLVDSGLPARGLASDEAAFETFAQKRLLYWLEALSLLRATEYALGAIRVLLGVFSKTGTMRQDLYRLLRDAHRFISAHYTVIESYPLQIYASALLFSPTDCVVRNTYKSEQPKWVTKMVYPEKTWGASLQTWYGHQRPVCALAVSGAILATASLDETVRIWKLENGQCLAKLCTGDADLTGVPGLAMVEAFHPRVSFSPSGRLLASTDINDRVLVWSTETWSLVRSINVASRIHRICLYHDPLHLGTDIEFVNNDEIVVAGDSLTVYHVLENRSRPLFHGELMSHQHQIGPFAVSPDPANRYAFVTTDGQVHVCHAEPETYIVRLQAYSTDVPDRTPLALSFSQDGKMLAFGTSTGELMIWETASWTCRGSVSWGQPVAVIAFSPNSKLLVTAPGERRTSWTLWDVTDASLSRLSDFEGHSLGTAAATFSADGCALMTGGCDSRITTWDVALLSAPDGVSRPIRPFRHDADPGCFSESGQELAFGHSDGTVTIWSADGSCQPISITSNLSDIKALAFTKDARLLALASSPEKLALADMGDGVGRPVDDLPETGDGLEKEKIRKLAFSDSGNRLVSLTVQARLRIWDIPSRKLVTSIQLWPELDSWADDFAISPGNGDLVAVAGIGGLAMYDITSGAIRHGADRWTSWASCSAYFVKDSGDYVAIVQDSSITIWSASTCSCLYTITTGPKLGYINFRSTSPNLVITTVNGTICLDSLEILIGRSETECHYRLGNRSWQTLLDVGHAEWASYNGRRLLWLPSRYRFIMEPKSGPRAESGTLLNLGAGWDGVCAFLHVDHKHLD